MSETEGSLLTPRLVLVPIGPGNAADLWLVHSDDAVVPWYDGWRPSRDEINDEARRIAESWLHHGVHKWMAYDRESGEVVGRGGLSRTPIDDDWGQLYALLPDQLWVREAHASSRPFRAHAHWLEIGWALRGAYWGEGYASEIGRAGLRYAFDVLGMRAWCRAPCATTCGPGRSWSASGCATWGRSTAAAHSMASRLYGTTRLSPSA